MTKAIETRVAKLEAKTSNAIDDLDIAVLRTPLPHDDLQTWAANLVSRLGWSERRGAVWVLEGEERILLPMTPVVEVRGEDEAIWLRAASEYPHIVIHCAAGGLYAYRLESADDERARRTELERLIDEHNEGLADA